MSRRLVWIVPFAIFVLTACQGKPVNLDTDAGTTIPPPQVCAADNECAGYDPANPRVRCNGICIYLCNGINDECNGAPNGDLRYCDSDGVCSFGCRAGTACANAGELCLDGVCRAGSSQCATRCDCEAGEVCSGGQCQQPSSTTCASGEDCPRGPRSPTDNCNAVACNGVSDTCFEPAPEPCAVAGDCVGRFGCTGGATCACNNQRCVPSAACTPQNEATTCGAGNYCDANNLCQALPSCTQPSDCTSAGLACNAGTSKCERSKACTVSADCTIAPNSFCPVGGGFCGIASCLNGGVTCTGGQECSSQGRCVSPGLGACVGDGDCATNAYCDVTAGECRLGCRNNASCPSGQECGGDRQCTVSGGGLGYGQTCGADSDCRSPMLCGTSTSTCAETCATEADCSACNAASPAGCRCNFIGFCIAN